MVLGYCSLVVRWGILVMRRGLLVVGCGGMGTRIIMIVMIREDYADETAGGRLGRT